MISVARVTLGPFLSILEVKATLDLNLKTVGEAFSLMGIHS